MSAQQKDFGTAGDRDLFVADLNVYRLMGWGDLGPYLHGVHRRDRWTEDYQAECLTWPRKHEGVADPDCTCGIYGWYRPDRDWDSVGIDSTVFAVVRLSGRCVLGSLGVRAERAQILAVTYDTCKCGCSSGTAVPQEFADAMTECYPGVKVYADREALLRDFPPSDWESIVGPIEEPKREAERWVLPQLSVGAGYLAAYKQLMQWSPTPSYYYPPTPAPVVWFDEPAPKPAPPVKQGSVDTFLSRAESAPTDAVTPERQVRVGLPSDLTITKAAPGAGPQRDPFRRLGRTP